MSQPRAADRVLGCDRRARPSPEPPLWHGVREAVATRTAPAPGNALRGARHRAGVRSVARR
jgi:hypothetical protein